MNLKKNKRIILPLIVAIIAAVLIAGVNQILFTSHQKYANSTIELVYNGAADGLAPNGELFSITSIKSDENLKAAIDASGLDVNIQDLKNNFVVRGIYSNDLADQMSKYDSLLVFSTSKEVSSSDEHPTKYSISLNNNFAQKYSKEELIRLLNCIIDQYKTFFEGSYFAKIDWKIVDGIANVNDDDFLRSITNMQYEVELMKSYGNQLANVDSSFEHEGIGFSDFAVSCDAFINNTLSGLLANVYMTGSSADLQRSADSFAVKLIELNTRKAALTKNANSIDSLINIYSIDSSVYLSSEFGSPVIKSNSSSTYEKLVEERKSITQELISLNSDISKLEEDMSKISGLDDNDSSSQSKLAASIEAAKEKLNSLKQQFSTLCEAFNKEYASEEVLNISDISYDGGFSITSFVKQCIKFGIVTVGLAVVYILCIGIFDEFRKKKGNY